MKFGRTESCGRHNIPGKRWYGQYKVSLVDSVDIRADAVEESASYTTDGGKALVCVAFPETDGR